MDKKMNRQVIKMIIILGVVMFCAAVMLCVAVLLIHNNSKLQSASSSSSVTQSAISPVSGPETMSSTPVSDDPQEPVFPEELLQLLRKNGTEPETLASLDCQQLVVVSSEWTRAKIYFYERSDEGQWTRDHTLMGSGFVGSQGTVTEMSEQVSGTPKGFYAIGPAFYIGQPPVTGLDLFAVTENTYWVDDPDSAFYNQRVEGVQNRDWKSAEHMIDYPSSYRYGFVIHYNMPPVYNKGSAIFFHIGSRPTQGCIAVSEPLLLQYLARLDQAKHPYILIL